MKYRISSTEKTFKTNITVTTIMEFLLFVRHDYKKKNNYK